jgi:MFS family permease
VTAVPARLGLRANAAQFALLVGVNALVGAMVGLERSVLPLIGRQDFSVGTTGAVLTFIVAFGTTKALTNLLAGTLADRAGRRRLLVLGWILALPVPILMGVAPTWAAVVVANLFLGASQGLAWSMTVVMKIDLVGPSRRGLALGLNESAGYLGVAVAAVLTGVLAAEVAPRTLIWVGGALIASTGLAVSLAFVKDTHAHVSAEQREHGVLSGQAPFAKAFTQVSFHDRSLRAYSQAGLVNNLNDALAWGLAPLYLAANGASASQIGAVAAVYPAVWGAGQLAAGWLSDHVGRKPLIVTGMLVQGGALALLAAGGGSFGSAMTAAVLLGVGTALVYPTLLAAVSDGVEPRDRAQAVGIYRFWRDTGLVAGGLLAGFVADALSMTWAITLVAGLTALSGFVVAASPSPRTMTGIGNFYLDDEQQPRTLRRRLSKQGGIP